MQCRECQKHLSIYLDGMLTAPECHLVEAHLASCPACAQELVSLRTVVGLLQDLPEMIPPKDLALSIKSKIKDLPQKKSRFVGYWAAWQRKLAVSMGIMAMAGLSILLYTGLGIGEHAKQVADTSNLKTPAIQTGNGASLKAKEAENGIGKSNEQSGLVEEKKIAESSDTPVEGPKGEPSGAIYSPAGEDQEMESPPVEADTSMDNAAPIGITANSVPESVTIPLEQEMDVHPQMAQSRSLTPGSVSSPTASGGGGMSGAPESGTTMGRNEREFQKSKSIDTPKTVDLTVPNVNAQEVLDQIKKWVLLYKGSMQHTTGEGNQNFCIKIPIDNGNEFLALIEGLANTTKAENKRDVAVYDTGDMTVQKDEMPQEGWEMVLIQVYVYEE